MVKNPLANVGDGVLIPELGRTPGEGHDNPLQYPYMGNAGDRRIWKSTIHGTAKSWP